ncbi:hypothetical protein ACFLTH_07555 [Bacteroidota bacterium]
MKLKHLIIFVAITAAVNNIYCQTADASATGISRAFNPAISVNSFFYYMNTDRDNPLWQEAGLEPGFNYKEICVEMTSNVDIYLQAKVALSAEKDHGVGAEEAYVTTLTLPIPVIFRAGLMFNTFGRHNLYHAHHMAFVERPMIHQQVFGSKLREVGIEASYLLHFPWYADVTVGILNGDNTYLFNSNENRHFAYLAHFDNVADLSDEITLRMGGSYLFGRRGLNYIDNVTLPIGPDTSKISSKVWGIDFHLKWKPMEYGRYHSFVLQGEYINSTLDVNDSSTKPLHGFFVQALGQVGLRWWLQARYDWFNRSQDLHRFFPQPMNFNFNNAEDFNGRRWSVGIAYVPTEFSAYKIQYNNLKLGDQTENQIVVQLNVTIGSHPAHKY